MRIRIHRGASEIGENCIELRSGNQFILLDIGMPLTANDINEVQLPDIEGLEKYDNPDFLGIVISHPHHIGQYIKNVTCGSIPITRSIILHADYYSRHCMH
jgi:ribonuclease J